MKTITLFEHETLSISNREDSNTLSISEVEALDKAQKAIGVRAFNWKSNRQIKAGHNVGVIAANSVRIEILPKISGKDIQQSRGTLMRMLSAALNIPIHAGSITDLGNQNHDILEILIVLFAERLLVQSRRGLISRYVQKKDDLYKLRGKLNTIRQFTQNASAPQRLACEYEEFSADQPLNQLLLCAVHELKNYSRHHKTQRLLLEVESHFFGVSLVSKQEALLKPIRIDRSNSHWAVIEHLARLLLQSCFQTLHTGKQKGLSLLFDMNRLFEAYVTRLARKSLCPLGYSVRSQSPVRNLALSHIETKCFYTKPDLHVQLGSQIFVLDAKWKRIDRSKANFGISQSDAYQMYAYAQIYRAESVILIYPNDQGSLQDYDADPFWNFEETDASLKLATLNMMNEAVAASEFVKLIRQTQN